MLGKREAASAAMSSSLRRVLQIRAMQEEQARMELELEAGRLHDLDRAATEAGHEAVFSRERWFAAVERESDGSAGRAGVEPERFAAESEWELAAWRRARAVRQRPAQQATMERARAEFLEGRRER